VRPDPSLSVDLCDLLYGEHLIVWAFRAFARGRDCPIVRREFDHGCGERAGEAFAAMRVFVQQWALKGRRTVVLAPPGGLSLARDEQTMLGLFAAAQAGDRAGFAGHFRLLTGGPPNPIVERAVTLVAEAMHARGHGLRPFADVAPAVDVEPSSRLIA
jgi:hypothetical protein